MPFSSVTSGSRCARKLTEKSTGAGEISPFQAVSTALASTVGVWNIAGVATPISIGGIVYLLGPSATIPYRLLWLVFIYLGAIGSLHLVWDVADTLNGLMAVPNLVAVLGSIGVLRRLIREFFESPR